VNPLVFEASAEAGASQVASKYFSRFQTLGVAVFDGTDPIRFVISTNIHRRHPTVVQRAEAGARLANLSHGTNRFGKK